MPLTGSYKCPTATSRLAAALSALGSRTTVACKPFASWMSLYSLLSCSDFSMGFVNTEYGGVKLGGCDGVQSG